MVNPIRGPIWHQAPPGWRWRTTTGDYWNFWCACSGRCELLFDGRTVTVLPGTCVAIPPHSPISADHDILHPVANLAIHGRLDPDIAPRLARRIVQLDPLRLRRLADDCLSAWTAGDEREYHALAMVLEARLLAAVESTRQRADRALEQIVLGWQQRPQAPWTVADGARRLGVSRSQFVRRFAAAYGRTPREHLQELRDEHALRLLRESDLTIDAIAEQAGYTDAAHLGRRIRARTGRSPGAFR